MTKFRTRPWPRDWVGGVRGGMPGLSGSSHTKMGSKGGSSSGPGWELRGWAAEGPGPGALGDLTAGPEPELPAQGCPSTIPSACVHLFSLSVSESFKVPQSQPHSIRPCPH